MNAICSHLDTIFRGTILMALRNDDFSATARS